jgi:hypothetical protein
MIQNYTDWLRGQPTDAQLDDWAANLQMMGEGSTAGRRSTEGFKQTVEGLRRENISRPMNQATDRLVAALTEVIQDIAATERFCEERVAELAERSPNGP